MHKKNNYIKLISIICTAVLAACNHGGNTEASSNLSKNYNKNKTSGLIASKDIPVEDLYSLNYDIRGNKSNGIVKKTCFAESTICVTQSNDIMGTYTLQGKALRWLIPDNLGTFKVELNYNKGQLQGGVRVKELFAELNNNQVQGYISELNADECEKVVPDGKGLATCNIRYAYHAITDNNQKSNINHMMLGWKDRSGKEQFGEVNFNTFNFLTDIDNKPVIEMVGFSEVNQLENKTREIDNDLYIGSSINNQIILKNVGDADLTPYEDEKYPITDIHAATAKTNSTFNMQDLEFHNPDIPLNCKYNDKILRGDACNFNFDYTRKFEEVESKETLTSQLGRLVFKYYLPKTGVEINYVPKFILSAGSINTTTIQKSLNESFTISLENIHNNANDIDPAIISYQYPNTEVKLSVEYKPGFFIPHSVKEGKIYYGIGDNYKYYNSSLEFKSIKNTSGDFIANEGTIEHSLLSYKVDSSIPGEHFPYVAPLGGLLVASYYSPIIGRNIRQIIGTISIPVNGEDVDFDYEPYSKFVPQHFEEHLLNYVSAETVPYPTNVLTYSEYMSKGAEVALCYHGMYNPKAQILKTYCWLPYTPGHVKIMPYMLDVSQCKVKSAGKTKQYQIDLTIPDWDVDPEGKSGYGKITTLVPVCKK